MDDKTSSNQQDDNSSPSQLPLSGGDSPTGPSAIPSSGPDDEESGELVIKQAEQIARDDVLNDDETPKHQN